MAAGEKLDLLPTRDGRGCADADDAMYTSHYFDQILNEESRLADVESIRPQPKTIWREDLPLIEVLP